MQIGNRIIYDQDGEIIFQTGEMQGSVLQRKEITSLDFIDLEFGQIDSNKYIIAKIDINTKAPVLEEIPQIETEEERLQREKEELENQLLMMADAEMGGIL